MRDPALPTTETMIGIAMSATRTSAIPAATAMLKRCTFLYACKGRRVLPDGPMLLPKDAAGT